MKVIIERPKKVLELEFKGLVSELLKKLDINPGEVIIARSGDLILSDELVGDDDEIRIMSVISGG